MMSKLQCCLLVTLLLLGCGDGATDPDPTEGVSVGIAPGTYSIGATIPVIVSNHNAETIWFLSQCTQVIEGLTEREWESAFVFRCPNARLAPIPVPPGGTEAYEISLDSNVFPGLDEAIAGYERLRLRLDYQVEGSAQSFYASSNSFKIDTDH